MARCQSWPSLLPLLAAAVIGGCSTVPVTRADLLGESYKLIDRFYLKPVHADKIGEASLDTLTKLDHDIVVEVNDRELFIKHGTEPVARFHAPDPNDWQAWGEIADRATTSAAAASPAISKLSDDDLDRTLLDGAVGALDQYSHYLSPEEARRSVLLEDQHTALDTSSGGDASHDVTGVKIPGALRRPPASVSLRIEGRIAIVHIRRFTTITGQLTRQALAEAFSAPMKPQGIILDLRDNPGGHIGAAVEVADLFLARGVVVALEGRHPSDTQVFSANFDGSIYETIPLVAVVNDRSASAAEVLAAALQGNGRALVVGTSTFGKGTTQRIIPLANGGELWLTSSYTRTPAGYLLQHHGVAPDICTPLAPENIRAVSAGPSPSLERFRSLVVRPRVSLHEAEWAELRRICSPSAGQSAGDPELEVAKQILRGRPSLRP